MNAKKKMKNENDVAGSICATKWKERKGKERNGKWIMQGKLNI